MGQIVNFETNHKTYIETLPVAEAVKNTVFQVDRVTANEDTEIKRSIPAFLIVSPKGAGTAELEEAFAKILDENHVHSMYGKHPFLKLSLPKDGAEEDMKKFLKSTKNIAPLQNKLYGTFAISFEEYTGADLLASNNFKILMHYVDENRENVYFLFRVYPEFAKQTELMMELAKHLNIQLIKLEKPDYKAACEYILQNLSKEGYKMSAPARKILLEEIVENLVVSQVYEGYISLNLLLSQIRYKMATYNEKNIIKIQIIEELKAELEQNILQKNENVSIGFRA